MKQVPTAAQEVNYVTSSRAAQLSGYSQDYVGQLCREASIACKRVSGEWQVDIAALLAYKKRFNPDTVSSRQGSDAPNISTEAHEKDESIINGDDTYISSQVAAKRTGYSQDYIGQLARSGSVKAKKVGRKWFIDQSSLTEHKKHNDTLLAAVQAGAAGVMYPEAVQTQDPQKEAISQAKSQGSHTIPIVTYKRDDGSLVPGTMEENFKNSEESLPEVKTMAYIPTAAKQATRQDLRPRTLRSTQRYSPHIKPGSPAKNTAKQVVSMGRDAHYIAGEMIEKSKSSIFSKAIFAFIIAISFILITESFLTPDMLRAHAVKAASIAGISLKSTYPESTFLGKKTLQLFSTSMTYQKGQ